MKKEQIHKLEMEKAEVDRLVRNGFSFSVEYDVEKRKWWGKKYSEHKVENFRIEEPTLGTLDRMCREFVKMSDVNPESVSGAGMDKVYDYATKYIHSACRAIAYGVIGSDYGIKVKKDGYKVVDGLETRVGELAHLFESTMKPSDIKSATMYVLAANNIGDFLASIVLMSGQRTSKPDTIEER